MSVDALAAGYGGSVLAGALLVFLHRGYLPPVTVFGHFLHVALALCLPAFVLALLRRSWWGAGANAAGLALFAVLFGGRLAGPPTLHATPGAAELRVGTLNLGRREAIAEDVLRLVRDTRADVFVFQELMPAQADLLRRGLADSHPHQALEPDEGYSGMGIVSRLPLLDVELHPLTAPHPAQTATVVLDGRRVRLVNVHPKATLAFFERLAPQARDLPRLLELATAGLPTVLLGDLNSTDRTWVHDTITDAGLVDSWLEVGRGFGFTFPAFLEYHGVPSPPILRIDYVFHTPHLRALDIAVAPSVGADHHPLLCTLGWAGGRR